MDVSADSRTFFITTNFLHLTNKGTHLLSNRFVYCPNLESVELDPERDRMQRELDGALISVDTVEDVQG